MCCCQRESPIILPKPSNAELLKSDDVLELSGLKVNAAKTVGCINMNG